MKEIFNLGFEILRTFCKAVILALVLIGFATLIGGLTK